MTGGFHNFNSHIGNQVIGTLNLASSRDSELAFIRQQLDVIQKQIITDATGSAVDVKNALHAVEQMRIELAGKSPKTDILDRSLKTIEGISSIASLAGQIRAFLPGLS
jgi:hypothetical protein